MLTAVLALWALSACNPSAFRNKNVSAAPNPTANTYDASDSSTTTAPDVEQVKRHEREAQNERFKTAPEEFKQIDFANFTYPYKFANNKKRSFTLKDGEYEYEFSDDRGWFRFSDAYYVDLTGDGDPEAIVLLSRVSCGGSCDGGASLFYIYMAHQNKLEPVWQYDTGSLGYGCGLKSFTVKNRKITLELFGRCFDERKKSLVTEKFRIEDTTRFTFGFKGKKFIEEKKEFITVPERSVLNYESEIRINE